tara:strand:+ start:563 stop:1006 length:444 start_codon:yes stop_codon:yes gene_type:complete
MLDIKWIRDNPDKLDAALARRGAAPLAEQLLKLDEERRAHLTRLQTLQGRRNEASKAIGKAKGTGDEAGAEELIREIGEIKEAIQDGEETERRIDKSLEDALARIRTSRLTTCPRARTKPTMSRSAVTARRRTSVSRRRSITSSAKA